MSQSSLLTRSILGMFALVSMVDASSATTILDAWHDADILSRTYYIVGIDDDDYCTPAQTFTPTVTGKLAGIAIRAYKSGSVTQPLVVKILSTSNGVPSQFASGILGSVTLQPGSLPMLDYDRQTGVMVSIWTYIDFSSFNIPVLANQQMAISLQSSGLFPQGYYRWHTAEDLYAGGQHWDRGGKANGPWVTATPNLGDYSFQTFVTIPEPSAAVLTTLAALGFVRLRRVRRRAMA